MLEFESLVMCKEGVRHPTTPVQGQSFVFIKPLFLKIGNWKQDIGISFTGLWTHWALRFGFGMGVVPINVSLVHSIFGAKFPRWKFGSISPCFRGKNLAAIRLRCIIAHKTLFSPSFSCENTATEVPHFHGENPAKFHIWCAMAHRQGFSRMCIWCVSIYSYRDESKPFKASSTLMRVAYTRKPMSLKWHGSR